MGRTAHWQIPLCCTKASWWWGRREWLKKVPWLKGIYSLRRNFQLDFLNSWVTWKQLTLRKTQDFLGETHGSTGAHGKLNKQCQNRWPLKPSVLSPAVAVSQQPEKVRTRQPWAESTTIPSTTPYLLLLSISLLPAFALSSLELLLSQPQQQHHS